MIHGSWRARAGIGPLVVVLSALAMTLAAAEEIPDSISYCLACHEDPGLSLSLDDGTELSLYVDIEEFQHSIHGSQLVCTDCHADYDGDDHPQGTSFASKRAYVIHEYETCKKCHFDTYTRTLESVHFDLLKEGLDLAPVCTDCHGAHDVHNPHEKQAMMARSCASCHVDVYDVYAKSVHGKALTEEGIQDVPACAGCHTHHSIEPPSTVRFRLESPEICINCHGDEEIMARYDIPTEVASTYLTDFHGVTASLSDLSDVEDKQVVVTCVDCHGVHDIAAPQLVGAEQMKETVAETCASCHEGASVDFPQAWLSHYRPSLRHAPLVYLVSLFYKIFIPFVVFGLLLQVLLHLYRVAVGR
ncbi:MAG: cytochrome c3 family protein [Acidobacteriota bacterium]|nr:MAG: cytochrome c3 family protein [Acidobacteriota bacterium]